MACSECGSENVETVDAMGMLEIWRCSECGHEDTVHVHYADFNERVLEDHRNGPPRVFMVGRWRGRPSKEQAEQVRNLLVPERKLTATQIMRAGFESRPIDFGPSLRSTAEAMIDALDSLGMDVELTPMVF